MTAPSTELRIPKGTIIFRQGDPGNEMFVVAEGRVRLTLGTEGRQREIAVCAKGDFFGELSLLTGAARTATAEAIEDSTLLTIGRDVFAMMVQDDIDIVFRMMHIQGQRLGRTNRPLEALTRQVNCIRVLAEGLKRFLAGDRGSAVELDMAQLVEQLHVSRSEVYETVVDAARRGAGTLGDGRWRIDEPRQAQALVEALCSYASIPGEPPSE